MDKFLTHQRRIGWGKVVAFFVTTTFLFSWSFALPSYMTMNFGLESMITSEKIMDLGPVKTVEGIAANKVGSDNDEDDDDHTKTPRPTKQEDTSTPIVVSETSRPTDEIKTPTPSEDHKTPTSTIGPKPTETPAETPSTFTQPVPEERPTRQHSSATSRQSHAGPAVLVSTPIYSATPFATITPSAAPTATVTVIPTSEPSPTNDFLNSIPNPKDPFVRDWQQYQFPLAVIAGTVFFIAYHIMLKSRWRI